MHKYLQEVYHKSEALQQKLEKRSISLLDRFSRQQQQLNQKFSKLQKGENGLNFDALGDTIAKLRAGFATKQQQQLTTLQQKIYLPELDTMQTTLRFLSASGKLTNQYDAELKQALKSVNELHNRLNQTETLHRFLEDHKRLLKSRLSSYNLFKKDVEKINKESYYYNQQIKNYTAMLKDRRKAEAKALKLLKESVQYKDFVSKNSWLAGLFPVPPTGTSPSAALQELQTQAQVEQQIQQRLGADLGARQLVSERMNAAQSRFNELKSKYQHVDNTADMPGFKPNEMKSKSFFQRLEFGINLQMQRRANWYPTATDLAGQLSYQFAKNGHAGFGVAYQLSWMSSTEHFSLRTGGYGIRSFVDWKLKRSFYLNAGFEHNYNIVSVNTINAQQWKGWRSSALLGISKQYNVSNKVKGNVILLYDFLSSYYMPRTRPLKLRIGYNFR
ncbi:hypothetical protein [Chitinophaga sp. S165]|uniref:hypothetical protein n=1 Tax=Chitinophaga sp. S165 TaxID=2135462 RepID=UPI0011B854F1|nr:hypothetical protein [Chitinophaga sp. S165]